MFWIGTWTAFLALLFWAGCILGFFAMFGPEAGFGVPFVSSSTAFLVALCMVLVSVTLRILGSVLNLVMTAFGRPLFYDLKID